MPDPDREDLIERARGALEQAELEDDVARLELLEELYEALERDLDQASAPGR